MVPEMFAIVDGPLRWLTAGRARVAMFRSVSMVVCVPRSGMCARAALSRLVLPCIDKEGDNSLFAKRFGGL
jgi:hypothetical protein